MSLPQSLKDRFDHLATEVFAASSEAERLAWLAFEPVVKPADASEVIEIVIIRLESALRIARSARAGIERELSPQR